MINTTRENFAITEEMGFTLLGVDRPNSRKATQMVPGDQLLYYLRDERCFVATAEVSSRSFQDQSPIWKSHVRNERFRHRVRTAPDVVPPQELWVDAFQIGPGLEYVRRWPPEMWELSFFGMVHIFSKRDFDLIRGELVRYLD